MGDDAAVYALASTSLYRTVLFQFFLEGDGSASSSLGALAKRIVSKPLQFIYV